MPGQETVGPPVIVTFPAQLDAAPRTTPPARSLRRSPWRQRCHRRPGRRRVLRPLSHPASAQGPPQGHNPGRAGALRDPPGRPAAPDYRLRRQPPAARGLPHPPARPGRPAAGTVRQPHAIPAPAISPAPSAAARPAGTTGPDMKAATPRADRGAASPFRDPSVRCLPVCSTRRPVSRFTRILLDESHSGNGPGPLRCPPNPLNWSKDQMAAASPGTYRVIQRVITW
jgi:hypothetical protein